MQMVRTRIRHKLAKLNQHGDASALCYARPHKIPETQRFTVIDRDVTCRRCLVKLRQTNDAVPRRNETRGWL